MNGEPPMQSHEADAAAPPTDGGDVVKLHQEALQAEKHLETLATGLAKVADDKTVKAVQQMADVMRQLVQALAGKAHEAAPPAEPTDGSHTMASATDSMTNDLRAKRNGG